ncbi:MAG: hypothetical protein COA78_18625 [Blastopirellula sp.]|nr:MAG: hypothetical protein COA78_18625 [Blastopirellula sp.]
MNRMLIICLVVMGLGSNAYSTKCRAEEPQFEFKTPAGWRSERFALPAKFAPQMKFTGVEELRFAPGMYQRKAEDFLSYLFVFALENEGEINQAALQTELTAYYRGLSALVLKKKANDLAGSTTVKLELSKARQELSADWVKVKSYSGTVAWTEPFVTKKQQKLLITVDQFSVKGQQHQFVFVCASPANRDANIWKTLHQIRRDFSVKE